jgi:hypothetical protein
MFSSIESIKRLRQAVAMYHAALRQRSTATDASGSHAVMLNVECVLSVRLDRLLKKLDVEKGRKHPDGRSHTYIAAHCELWVRRECSLYVNI